MTRNAPGAATDAQKLLYLAPRPADVTPNGLAPVWAVHQQKILDQPVARQHVTRYELCKALVPADDPSLPEAFFQPGAISDAWGGVGEAWLEGGMDALVAISSDPAIVASRDHEAEVFGEPIVHSLVVQDETIFDKGGTELKIFSFLHRQPHLSRGEFADLWGGFADLFLEHEELTRHCTSYVQSHVVAPDDSLFDGVAIMGFSAIENMLSFMAEPSMVEELFPAEAPFLDRAYGIVVLTTPTVLLDRDAG